MRKVLIKSIAVVFISLFSFSAFASSIDYCTDHACWFWSIYNNPSKVRYFYCRVSDNVTNVKFDNHNVRISGFSETSGGVHILDGRDEVAKLYTHYFEVKDDPNHSHWDPKTVVFKADGKIVCEPNKGGRTKVFGCD